LKKVTHEFKPILTVFTIGHSTHTLEEFIKIIEKFKIEEIVDVRTIPRSRHNPQFNKETLPSSLLLAGIGYMHIAGLGGLKHTKVDSPNKGWRNASFRGYADYMQTPDFDESLNMLIEAAKKEQIAIMCAESLPWRCHRSLIADALLVKGFKVEHIMNNEKSLKHTLTPWIIVEGKKITYPPASNKKE
jgi:uncharacterized protein (DUF488 family)